jgi:hypothetical protein
MSSGWMKTTIPLLPETLRKDAQRHFHPPVFLDDSFLPPPVFSLQAQLAGLAACDSGAQRED